MYIRKFFNKKNLTLVRIPFALKGRSKGKISITKEVYIIKYLQTGVGSELGISKYNLNFKFTMKVDLHLP